MLNQYIRYIFLYLVKQDIKRETITKYIIFISILIYLIYYNLTSILVLQSIGE